MLTEELIRGQAQHLIGALLAHNFVPKTLPEELYVKLWDVVMAQLKCVNHEGARAIESAACKERDARIAELERALEEARKDAVRYRFAADPQSDGYAVCEWFHDGWIPISTEDIDAAIKEQT